MRVLVFGSRHIFHDTPLANGLNAAAALDMELCRLPKVDVIIHGNAPGADRVGQLWADRYLKDVLKFNADWDKHGKAAGPIRNKKMLDEGRPDYAVGLWDGYSPGSRDMLLRLVRAGIPVKIIPGCKG